MIRRLWEDEEGQAMVEYALVAGAICIGLMASIKILDLAFSGQYANQHKGLQRAR
jgi:Flp pilus assembly pilin Flp